MFCMLLSIYSIVLVSAQDLIINNISIPDTGTIVAGEKFLSVVYTTAPGNYLYGVRACQLVEVIALTAHLQRRTIQPASSS
jgi:uncharacterized protein with NRDE domain